LKMIDLIKIWYKKLKEGKKLKGERATITKVNTKFTMEKMLHKGKKIWYRNWSFFIKDNEKDEDLLHEATEMHEGITNSLLQYKIRNKSSI
jgi:hypothetical protein